jgi:purine nucleoside permease
VLFITVTAFAAERLPVKVVVLAGFEVGDDTGDAPGELQFWVEREGLTQQETILKIDHPLVHNAQGLYALVGGNTRDHDLSASRISELITALCLDPRYDLAKTYWLIDGIAGLDPAVGSIGSAAWAENVVNGDAMREIDDRELPAGWPFGLFAIGTKAPNELPGVTPEQGGGWGGEQPVYSMNRPLNAGLARWAQAVSKDVVIPDSPALAAFRRRYTNYPAAQLPPSVIIGDALGSMRYWHGQSRTEWARGWVKLWTKGKGTFATTSMEAQTYADVLAHMAEEGRVDFSRVMVLRTGANYCLPPPGTPIMETMGDETLGTSVSLEAAYRVGAAVAHELLAHWDRYEHSIPAK